MSSISIIETRHRYDGAAGAFLPVGSILSLHEPLVGRLFRHREFDISRCHRILDVGSGAGQILKHIVAYGPRDGRVVAFDLSPRMLGRARSRIASHDPAFVAGDVSQLPFRDESFDCVTCGWVVEHVPDIKSALQELARVLQPRGRLLLLATEDTWAGAILSRMWRCRTCNRQELHRVCDAVKLKWTTELWLTPIHRLFGMGGILVEAQKVPG